MMLDSPQTSVPMLMRGNNPSHKALSTPLITSSKKPTQPTTRHSRRGSHPPQQQDAVHRELRPGTGKGASAGTGPPRRATQPAAGRAQASPPPPPAPPPQPHTTRPPPTTTGRRQGGYPVVSNRPLHRAMQQRCHHASASARSPSWPPMPRPHLLASRERSALHAEQNFL